MKIQCNACEVAEARVLCCADEAALCWACDEKVHAANKLAGKHQRVPLTSGPSSAVPKCDICKDSSGYFFCLEDRALLCRKCDTAVHSVNSHVSAHQRFIITGVKVGQDHPEQVSSNKEQSSPVVETKEFPPKQFLKRTSSVAFYDEASQIVSSQVDMNSELPITENSLPGAGGSQNGSTYWPPEDFFDFSNFNQNYGFIDHGSSKADSGKLESLEGSPICSSTDEELNNELFCQVPEFPWMVPEVPSPPTASGLNWPKNSHREFVEDSAFVPDINYASEDLQQCQRGSPVKKRRRPYCI